MIQIFILMFSAIFIENIIFSKFYGCCPFMGVSEKPETAAGMGMAVTFVITVSSSLTWIVDKFVLVKLNIEFLRTIAFVLIIAALVQFIEMFLRRYLCSLYNSLGIFLPLITTNCAVLGTVLVNVQKNHSFSEAIAFAFASSLGFTLAIVIFAGVRVRLRFSEPPKSFKGMPLALITAGLIALAFVGFSGMSIA